jgi:proteasome-associated ATPase
MPEELENRMLLRWLAATGDGVPGIEEKIRHLQTVRGEAGDPAARERLDRVLVEEIARLSRGLEEAENAQQELREMFDRMLAPPLHPAVFLGYADPDGTRAMVGHQSSRRVVTLSEDEALGELEPGNEVLLSNELNTIVSRSPRETCPPGETALFDRATEDGRLVLSCRGEEEVVVDRSARLAGETLRRGDIIQYDRSLWFAYGRIDRSKGDGYFLQETPSETFDDIGGLEGEILTLKRMLVFRKEHGGAARKYALRGKGSALLDGPPGNGKTLLVRALANWLGSISPSGRSLFMNVKPAELHSMWYAQSEANYREIFRAAREAGAADPDRPVVLFFDEIDAIGEARTGSVTRGPGERVLRAFLAELDGLDSRGNIVVIGATNRPDLLDPALARSGRMGDKPIHIPRPNRDTARKIFEKHLEPGIPYAAGGEDPALCRSRVIDSALARIFSPNGDGDLCSLTFRDGSKRTVRARDLISGASIAQIAIGAKERACLREVETGEEGIRLEDVLSAVAGEMDALASYLTPRNCREYLTDLPQDLDVVAVRQVRRSAPRPYRYLNLERS